MGDAGRRDESDLAADVADDAVRTDLSHGAVVVVGDEDGHSSLGFGDRNARRPGQGRPGRGPVITARAKRSASGDRGDDPLLSVDLANEIVMQVGNVNVAV